MRRLVLSLVLLAGCLSPVDPPVTERQGAVGEPMNGFPSALERLGLMAINRARSDPETVKGAQSTSYAARPPVIWSLPLNQSARFHTVSLETSDVTLMHPSPCTLNTDVATSGCTGDPSCACASAIPSACAACANPPSTTTCGTDPFVRIGYFTSASTPAITGTGEVAAAGYGDPIAVVDGWMDEAAGSDGHRKILTDTGTTANTMGYGHASGSNCYDTFDVADAGNLKTVTVPKIPTAAVSPASGKAGTFTFYATWADPSLGTPASLNVALDGVCTPMTLEIGTDKLNATYKATATLAAGCHTYYVVGVDASSARVSYPSAGGYNIPVGSATCSADYVATTSGANCDPGTATTGVAGANGQGGSSGTGSGGSSGSTGSAGTPGSGGTSGGGGNGGVSATGGSGTGGTTGSGGTLATGSGGARASGGSTGSGGAGSGGTTGQSGSSGATGSGGATGLGGSGDKVTGTGGCSCDVGTPGLPSTSAGLVLMALLLFRRRMPEPQRVRRRG
jgi:collagen type VII alpha